MEIEENREKLLQAPKSPRFPCQELPNLLHTALNPPGRRRSLHYPGTLYWPRDGVLPSI